MQSFTSVFQPGTAFMWCALAKTTSKLPSRRLKRVSSTRLWTPSPRVCTPRATAAGPTLGHESGCFVGIPAFHTVRVHCRGYIIVCLARLNGRVDVTGERA